MQQHRRIKNKIMKHPDYVTFIVIVIVVVCIIVSVDISIIVIVVLAIIIAPSSAATHVL